MVGAIPDTLCTSKLSTRFAFFALAGRCRCGRGSEIGRSRESCDDSGQGSTLRFEAVVLSFQLLELLRIGIRKIRSILIYILKQSRFGGRRFGLQPFAYFIRGANVINEFQHGHL